MLSALAHFGATTPGRLARHVMPIEPLRLSVRPRLLEITSSTGTRFATAPASVSRAKGSSGSRAKVQPEEISYSVVIELCSRKGEAGKAAGWLEEMTASAFKPNVFVFNSVIACFARNGSSGKAIEWLERMIAEGLKPNLLSYNSVIDACAKVGDLDGAVAWYKLMVERGVKPDERSFNAVIRSCARSGNVVEALRWLKKMSDAGIPPGDVAYNSAIRSCANARPQRASDDAERLFIEMRTAGLYPTATLISALGEAVGRARRDELCHEYGVNIRLAQRRTPKSNMSEKLQLRPGRWRADGGSDVKADDLHGLP